MSWLRRVRGAIGMGLTWAVAGFMVGFIPRWVLGMEGDLPFPLLFFGLGFISGVIFSALLVLTSRKRKFDQMTLPRFAISGGAGGLLLSALFVRGAGYATGQVLAISTTFALASAACAAGSLALARKAQMQELPGSTRESLPDAADERARLT